MTKGPLTPEEQEKAKLLHASGRSVWAVATILGRSLHTLAKFLRTPEVARQVNVQREELAALFDDIAHKTLTGVSDEDVRKASLLQKLTAAGIAVDKGLLLRGQPTGIDVHILMDVASMLRGDRSSLPNQSPPVLSPPAKP